MRFQLPELHCFYVPGLFFTRLQNSRNLSKQQIFANFFASLFRQFSAARKFPSQRPASGHTKKGSPTKRNCPKTWKSFL